MCIRDSATAFCSYVLPELGSKLNIVDPERLLLNQIPREPVSYTHLLEGADVFIGVSKPGILTTELCKTMNKDFHDIIEYNDHPAIVYGARVSRLILDQVLACEGKLWLD